MAKVDDYIKEVVEKGDKGSEILASKCAHTLKNSELVDIISSGKGGLACLRIPEDHYAIVHSQSGFPHKHNVKDHTASMVDSLVSQANSIGAKPVAFANIIDSRSSDLQMISDIADSLVEESNKNKVAIINGELAILGNRLKTEANVSGTMISIIKKDIVRDHKSIIPAGIYAYFDPEGKPIMINSDGVGTKTEFYERAGKYKLAGEDFLAMNLDDACKIGAIPKVISGVIETKGDIDVHEIKNYISVICYKMGIVSCMHHSVMENRLNGFSEESPSLNISGSVVSTIDENRLSNPLKPSAGEYLIAIHKKKPNPRSNGITDKRKAMIKWLGDNWHETETGQEFIEYLAEPSAILYPIFNELIDKGLATSVYHMSGGAFESKLAMPIAKHGLFGRVSNLFSADEREIKIMELLETSVEDAYRKWPMGNDGFITTSNPQQAIQHLVKLGYDAKLVGHLEQAARYRGLEIQVPYNEKRLFFGHDK
jgi:phosphoribosylaminoimidazole (AIR) synthetase